MKRLFLIGVLLATASSGCDVWVVRPAPYNIPTPLPTRTPSIYTPTPVILAPPVTGTATSISLTPPQPTSTGTALSPTPTPTNIDGSASVLIHADVLGCDTSIDITHGMGEVTNAYVTVSNISTTDLENVCATLRGLDEGRAHPDKTKCVPLLPARNRVTFKLTVDTTYKKDTPIQVDINSDIGLLERIGQDSCTDISLFPDRIDDLDVVEPIQ
jgi:hypothetical protein